MKALNKAEKEGVTMGKGRNRLRQATRIQTGLSRLDFLKVSGLGIAGATLLGGCGGLGGQESSDDFPSAPITMIVPVAAGGGTDTGIRTLQPYVEEELGTTMNVVNQPGGGTWVGLTEVVQAEPNGYTLGAISNYNMLSGYLDPRQNRDQNLESFSYIANHVTDVGTIAIRPDDDRFSNVEELIEHAKGNTLTVTSTGVGSDKHYSALQLNAEHGTRLEAIHNEGTAEGVAAVLGGTVDVLIANVGEVMSLYEDGEVNVVVVSTDSEERSEFLPDVPTLLEAGYGSVYHASSRGIAGPAGIDPEIIELLAAAFENAISNEEHRQEMEQLGLQIDYRDPTNYREMLERDEQIVRDLGSENIW